MVATLVGAAVLAASTGARAQPAPPPPPPAPPPEQPARPPAQVAVPPEGEAPPPPPAPAPAPPPPPPPIAVARDPKPPPPIFDDPLPEPPDRRGELSLAATLGYRRVIDVGTTNPYRDLLEHYGHGTFEHLLELRGAAALRVARPLDVGVAAAYLYGGSGGAGTFGEDGFDLHVFEATAFIRPNITGTGAAYVGVELDVGIAVPFLQLRGQTEREPSFTIGPALVFQSDDFEDVGAQFRIGWNFARVDLDNGYDFQIGGFSLALGVMGWPF